MVAASADYEGFAMDSVAARQVYLQVELVRNLMAHGDAREGK